MVKSARATPRRGSSLPDDIVWEILVRLPPKSLLRCRSVCRAWRRVTYAPEFLLAHHAYQPSLPIFSGDNILAFDHPAATDDDHTVAQFDEFVHAEASCDGLLVLRKRVGCKFRLSICNPATREHALLVPPGDLGVMGMYLHRPTGEYRLLLQRRRWDVSVLSPKDQIACYVFVLGSDQPLRYIERPEMASGIKSVPIWLHDSLHWYPVYHHGESMLIVFDTIAESFRLMREPIVAFNQGFNSYICHVDGTLGIYTYHYSTQVIDIHMLQNYEREVWDLKYRIKLPAAEIRMKFHECDEYCDMDADDRDGYWDFDLFSVDSGVALQVFYRWLIRVDCDGKLVSSFYRGRGGLSFSLCFLKQSLVRHAFFPALEGYVVNASPFIGPVEYNTSCSLVPTQQVPPLVLFLVLYETLLLLYLVFCLGVFVGRFFYYHRTFHHGCTSAVLQLPQW